MKITFNTPHKPITGYHASAPCDVLAFYPHTTPQLENSVNIDN